MAPFCVAIEIKRAALRALLASYRRLMVAYSGGVDSSYLLAEAVDLLGGDVLAAIADSPSLPRKSLENALALARDLGAKIEVLETEELNDPRYSSNPVNRCYFCKAELFQRMEQLARRRGYPALAYGENADDALEVRPGSRAAEEFRVLAPLRLAGLTKAEIRQLLRSRNLSIADAPAQPCLSSRIAHGIPVTTAALGLIERAEDWVRSFGLRVFRVRYLPGNDAGGPCARLQVAQDEMHLLQGHETEILQELLRAGFSEAMIDPNGYRSPARQITSSPASLASPP